MTAPSGSISSIWAVNATFPARRSTRSNRAECTSVTPVASSRQTPPGVTTPSWPSIASRSGTATSKTNSPPASRCALTRRRQASCSSRGSSACSVFIGMIASGKDRPIVKSRRSPSTHLIRAATSAGSASRRRPSSRSIPGLPSSAQTSWPSRASGIATRPTAAPRSSTGPAAPAASARQNGRSSA